MLPTGGDAHVTSPTCVLDCYLEGMSPGGAQWPTGAGELGLGLAGWGVGDHGAGCCGKGATHGENPEVCRVPAKASGQPSDDAACLPSREMLTDGGKQPENP